MDEEILPISRCRELVSEAAEFTEEDLGALRACALSLAEIVAQAYADFRAEAGDIDPEEIRATGFLGMAKLMSVDVSDEDLDEIDAELEGGSDGE